MNDNINVDMMTVSIITLMMINGFYIFSFMFKSIIAKIMSEGLVK